MIHLVTGNYSQNRFRFWPSHLDSTLYHRAEYYKAVLQHCLVYVGSFMQEG